MIELMTGALLSCENCWTGASGTSWANLTRFHVEITIVNFIYSFICCDAIFGNNLVLDLPALSWIAPSHSLTLMTKLSAKLIVWKLISWYSLVMTSSGFLHICLNINSDLNFVTITRYPWAHFNFFFIKKTSNFNVFVFEMTFMPK